MEGIDELAQLNDWALLFLGQEDIVRRTAFSSGEPEESVFESLTVYECGDGFQFEEFVQTLVLADGSRLRALALRACEGEAITETLWSEEQVERRRAEDERLLAAAARLSAAELQAFEAHLAAERRSRLHGG